MSVSQVRTYFESRINEVDSNLKRWQDPFTDENIPESLIDTYYTINYNTISASSNNDISFEDSVNVTITIFKKAYKNIVETYDELNDKALYIRLNCLQPDKISLTDNIRQVETISVNNEPIDVSNDNIIKIAIEFNARLYYKITDFSLS